MNNRKNSLSPQNHILIRKKYLFKKYNIKRNRKQNNSKCVPISDALQAVVDICNYEEHSILIKDFVPLLSKKLLMIKRHLTLRIKKVTTVTKRFFLFSQRAAICGMIKKLNDFSFGTTLETEIVNARQAASRLIVIFDYIDDAIRKMHFNQLLEVQRQIKKMRLNMSPRYISKDWELRSFVLESMYHMNFGKALSLFKTCSPLLPKDKVEQIYSIMDDIRKANVFLNDFMTPLFTLSNVVINKEINFFEDHSV
jgi:hypothetical protein